ncbi:hypothetical protein VVR12_01665 [Rothia sp. LK2588]|uniref:hypothetical protein n=1 Tax=Rothia sp. LK2588 TaxID=3114369 RepID=UPI0034CFE88A
MNLRERFRRRLNRIIVIAIRVYIDKREDYLTVGDVQDVKRLLVTLNKNPESALAIMQWVDHIEKRRKEDLS